MTDTIPVPVVIWEPQRHTVVVCEWGEEYRYNEKAAQQYLVNIQNSRSCFASEEAYQRRLQLGLRMIAAFDCHPEEATP